MQLLSLASWLLTRRLRHSWLLLAVTSFGILASVTIMSTGALYSRALGEAGLRHTLASFRPEVLNAQVTAQNRPLGRSDYLTLHNLVQESAEERLGELLRGTERIGTILSNLPMLHTPASYIPSARPFFLTGFTDHTSLVQGRWPKIWDSKSQGEVETVIGVGTSRQLGFGVGDQITLVPFPGSPERLLFDVVGLAEPIDSHEEYWMGSPTYFDITTVGTVGESVVVPLFVNEEDFFGALATRYPMLGGNFGFNLFLDPSYLTAENANWVKRQVLGLETDLNKRYPRTLVVSRLGRTVDEFNRSLTLARIPLLLYLSLVVVVVLYFLVLIAGFLGRSQAEEASLLRSRGASAPQVTGVLTLAEGVVALVAMAGGPFLAWIIVKSLLLDSIDPASNSETPIPLGLAADMFLMGALGGVIALLTLVAASVGRARLGALESLLSRARPPTVSFVHRYHLDILLVLVVVVIWYQVGVREGFVAGEQESQELNVDPTLVLGPMIALFAASILLLRGFPWLVRVLSWVGTRAGPAWFHYALLKLSRDPIPHGSLVIILMLAAALGVFGATFQSSLSQSQGDQARYRVGGEMVVRGSGLPPDAQMILEKIPGVSAVTPVLRDSVTTVDGRLGDRVQLLAVDSRTVEESSWFRKDFFAGGLREVGKLLRPRNIPVSLAGTGIPLPEDTVSLGVWVDSGELSGLDITAGMIMRVRIMAGAGHYRTISMGNVLQPFDPAIAGAEEANGRWRLFTGEFPSTEARGSFPLELVSVYFTSGAIQFPEGALRLDDITAFAPSTGPDGLIVEGFEGGAAWVPLANQGQTVDMVLRSTASARSGGASLQFSWQAPISNDPRGIHLPPGPFPVPAIGGPNFQVGQLVRVKLGGLAVPVQVVGLLDHFPTLYPGRDPFLLVDLANYREYVLRLPAGALEEPGEVWLSLLPNADRQGIIVQIRDLIPGLITIRDREDVASFSAKNPLTGGGWDGLTALSMGAIGITVLLAFSVHALVSVSMGRIDLAVIQVLGFSRLDLFLSLATERLIIAVLAIAAGSAMGYWPGLEILELMDLTPRGGAPVPPLVPSVNRWLMAGALSGLLAASVLSVGFATLAALRLKPSEVLRGGA